MKKGKKNIGWALLEGLCELMLTLLCLGTGIFIVSLFDVDFESPNVDYDLIILLGFIIFFVIFGIIHAFVQRIKKILKGKHSEIDPKEGFEIKNPKWAFWVCLLATFGCLIIFFVFLYLKNQDKITVKNFCVGYIFLALSVASAVGVYACIFEKLTFSDRCYKYTPLFGKNQLAKIEDISTVKILIVYYSTTKHGIQKKTRVVFYDKNKSILIKIIDDGTISKNEVFLKSLKYNRIKIIREEKYDY